MTHADRYNRRLALWLRHDALCSASPDKEAMARLFATLSDEALAIAAHNPDHSESARQRAFAELQARGAPVTLPLLPAPGFLSMTDVEQAVPKGVRGRERLLRWPAALVFISASTFFFAVASPEADREKERALRMAYDAGVLSQGEFARRHIERPDDSYETYGAREILRPDVQPYAEGYRRVMNRGALTLMIGALALCLWSAVTLFRSGPARILLLRKFNNRTIDDRLRHFVARNLIPIGHVFVLADKYYRRRLFKTSDFFLLLYPLYYRLIRYGIYGPSSWVSKLVLIPWDLVRGRLNRSSAGGPIRISSARDYRRFGERVADRISSNAQVMATTRRSVIVKTSDDWWKQTVVLLMLSADLIVVDLSDVTEGTQWEIEHLVLLGLLDRTVFIVRRDAEDAIAIMRENMRALLSTGRWERKIAKEEAERAFFSMRAGSPGKALVFDDRGRALEPDELHRRMREALLAGVGAKTAAYA